MFIECVLLKHAPKLISPLQQSTVDTKSMLTASTGATTVPMAWKAWARLRRISLYLGGPQVAMKGFAEVSRVERPEPTMNMEPQKPPKERLMAEGQNMRAPTP